MIDEQRKLELIGDSLVRIFTIEMLNEEFPELPYPYFYGGLMSALTSNGALQKIGMRLKETDVRFDPDFYGIPFDAQKRHAMAFETGMAIVYQTEGIGAAKKIFIEAVTRAVDLKETVKQRHKFGTEEKPGLAFALVMKK